MEQFKYPTYTFDNDTGYVGDYHNVQYKNWSIITVDEFDTACVTDLDSWGLAGHWKEPDEDGNDEIWDYIDSIEIKFEDIEYYKDEPFYEAFKVFMIINREAIEKDKAEQDD